MSGSPTRNVWLVVVEGHQSLDVTGPSDVFAGANAVLAATGSPAPRYHLSVVGPAVGPVAGESGLRLVADLSVAALASRVGMSERNFARVFRRELRVSPGRYVERALVDAARRSLESQSSGVDAIARSCGFGSAETMRRAFLRQFGVARSHYRKRFSHAHDLRSALVR